MPSYFETQQVFLISGQNTTGNYTQSNLLNNDTSLFFAIDSAITGAGSIIITTQAQFPSAIWGTVDETTFNSGSNLTQVVSLAGLGFDYVRMAITTHNALKIGGSAVNVTGVVSSKISQY